MKLSAAPTCDLIDELRRRPSAQHLGLDEQTRYDKLRTLMCELNNVIVDECLCGDDGEDVVIGMDAFVDLLPQIRHFIEPTEYPSNS